MRMLQYILQKDFEKYENQIKTEFNCNVDLTSEELIGGCIGENLSQNLLIDNSLKTLLTEEIKKTNFKIIFNSFCFLSISSKIVS